MCGVGRGSCAARDPCSIHIDAACGAQRLRRAQGERRSYVLSPQALSVTLVTQHFCAQPFGICAAQRNHAVLAHCHQGIHSICGEGQTAHGGV